MSADATAASDASASPRAPDSDPGRVSSGSSGDGSVGSAAADGASGLASGSGDAAPTAAALPPQPASRAAASTSEEPAVIVRDSRASSEGGGSVAAQVQPVSASTATEAPGPGAGAGAVAASDAADDVASAQPPVASVRASRAVSAPPPVAAASSTSTSSGEGRTSPPPRPSSVPIEDAAPPDTGGVASLPDIVPVPSHGVTGKANSGRKTTRSKAEAEMASHFLKLDEELGSGAFKTVYKAYDRSSGREVAWNEIDARNLPRSATKRLMAEVAMLQTLNHRRLIAFHAAWRTKTGVVLITELVTSGTLKQFLKRVVKVRLCVIKKFCLQILEGLHYLHTHKPVIIHRDLKCENILVNGSSGELLISDFGLSTQVSARKAHSVLGTPHFMAPELYDEVYDEKVDIYSFGMCVLEMVTGCLPYHECTNAAQIYKKVTQGIPPSSLERITLPAVIDFIKLCINFNPDKRPTAAQLLESEFLNGTDHDDEDELYTHVESDDEETKNPLEGLAELMASNGLLTVSSGTNNSSSLIQAGSQPRESAGARSSSPRPESLAEGSEDQDTADATAVAAPDVSASALAAPAPTSEAGVEASPALAAAAARSMATAAVTTGIVSSATMSPNVVAVLAASNVEGGARSVGAPDINHHPLHLPAPLVRSLSAGVAVTASGGTVATAARLTHGDVPCAPEEVADGKGPVGLRRGRQSSEESLDSRGGSPVPDQGAEGGRAASVASSVGGESLAGEQYPGQEGVGAAEHADRGGELGAPDATVTFTITRVAYGKLQTVTFPFNYQTDTAAHVVKELSECCGCSPEEEVMLLHQLQTHVSAVVEANAHPSGRDRDPVHLITAVDMVGQPGVATGGDGAGPVAPVGLMHRRTSSAPPLNPAGLAVVGHGIVPIAEESDVPDDSDVGSRPPSRGNVAPPNVTTRDLETQLIGSDRSPFSLHRRPRPGGAAALNAAAAVQLPGLATPVAGFPSTRVASAPQPHTAAHPRMGLANTQPVPTTGPRHSPTPGAAPQPSAQGAALPPAVPAMPLGSPGHAAAVALPLPIPGPAPFFSPPVLVPAPGEAPVAALPPVPLVPVAPTSVSPTRVQSAPMRTSSALVGASAGAEEAPVALPPPRGSAQPAMPLPLPLPLPEPASVFPSGAPSAVVPLGFGGPVMGQATVAQLQAQQQAQQLAHQEQVMMQRMRSVQITHMMGQANASNGTPAHGVGTGMAPGAMTPSSAGMARLAPGGGAAGMNSAPGRMASAGLASGQGSGMWMAPPQGSPAPGQATGFAFGMAPAFPAQGMAGPGTAAGASMGSMSGVLVPPTLAPSMMGAPPPQAGQAGPGIGGPGPLLAPSLMSVQGGVQPGTPGAGVGPMGQRGPAMGGMPFQ